MDTSKIDAEIASLEAKIKQLEEQAKAIVDQAPNEALAFIIHRKTCHSDHTEGCGWTYERTRLADGRYREDWSQSTHKRYLKKADTMIAALPDLAVYDIIRVIEAL